MEKRKIVRGIILAVLLVCAVFLIYSIVTDPLGEHDIMLQQSVVLRSGLCWKPEHIHKSLPFIINPPLLWI